MSDKTGENSQDNITKRLHFYLKTAEKYNKWREKAKHNLLVNIGPKLAEIEGKSYSGCGFHYAKEQTFGKLITALALPWQVHMNNMDKWESDDTDSIINEIMYEDLIKDVEEILKS